MQAPTLGSPAVGQAAHAAALSSLALSHLGGNWGRYQKQLEELLEDRPDFVQPAKRRNEVLGWVRSGLQDFSLSRSKVEWGIRIPWDASQTIYVWTDALQGYLSGQLAYAAPSCQDDAVDRH